MDAAGRKAFWDTLCSLHTYDHESARKLIEVSPWPQELCRFRAVNENSLMQLQNNEQFFSTADYYADPFDTFFSIDFILSAARIAGIQEIYQVVINDDNLLGKQKISEA